MSEQTVNQENAAAAEEAVIDTAMANENAQGGESAALSVKEAEALREEVANVREQLLRAHAEMQNVRRRAENDVDKARKFALERFVRELLPVVDSLEKATEAMSGKEVPESVAVFREGVEMTLSMAQSVIGKFDVEVVDPVGQPFSPEFHEAMSMVPNPDLAPNTVMAVLQKGYTLNGRLICPAMVMVSKAP
ncbi:MAG: nucleotide exchange factor GrpE [Hahellaceae bacterium]|nr:nucleotide exchange factor GrpE [Hahellaceae bacterium]